MITRNALRWVPVIIMVAGLAAMACRPALPSTSGKSEPARLESVAGSDQKQVVLTTESANRIGIQTSAVREQQVTRKRTVGGDVVSLQSGALLRIRATPSDLARVDRGQPARVRPIVARNAATSGAQAATAGLMARPADPPAGATPQPTAANAQPAGATPQPSIPALYYLVEGSGHGLAVGQPVLLELPLIGGTVLRRVVPYSAVLYDVGGATWTYTRVAGLTFLRNRVTVDYVDRDLAVLLDGPPVGTEVVTVGATELIGVELKVGG